jgi:hypothetical protein
MERLSHPKVDNVVGRQGHQMTKEERLADLLAKAEEAEKLAVLSRQQTQRESLIRLAENYRRMAKEAA